MSDPCSPRSLQSALTTLHLVYLLNREALDFPAPLKFHFGIFRVMAYKAYKAYFKKKKGITMYSFYFLNIYGIAMSKFHVSQTGSFWLIFNHKYIITKRKS